MRLQTAPDKIRNFHKQLSTIEQNKIMTLNNVICEAASSKETKRGIEAKLQLTKYRSSCFMQLFDDEPSPHETHLDQIKTERLAWAAAAAKKKNSREVFKYVGHDHS